jgi:hypothetical protein
VGTRCLQYRTTAVAAQGLLSRGLWLACGSARRRYKLASVTALSWPVVGREEELAFIERSRAEATSAIVLLGVAGVGKSRLAREALRQAEEKGLVTQWVQATRSAATVPLGAFAGVIPAGARSEDPLELLRLSAAALRELGGAHPLVLGIDDAQLLDDSSAALVLELTLSEAAFVVITLRTGEPVPDAVVSVWKDAGAARLELETLGAQETDALAEAIVGGPIEEWALRWIYATSLGNPLYVRELTRGALAGGALTDVHGLWRMPARPPVSASLTELIAVRMTGLSDAEHRALELLAFGEPLRVSELVSLTLSTGRRSGARCRPSPRVRPGSPWPTSSRAVAIRRPGTRCASPAGC